MKTPQALVELYEFGVLSAGALTGLQAVCGSSDPSTMLVAGSVLAAKAPAQPILSDDLEDRIKSGMVKVGETAKEGTTAVADQTIKATLLFGIGYALGAGMGVGMRYLPQVKQYIQQL